ncbi:MAG: YdjY domain-containing protein [Phycisphaerae bacterium]|nr:YdjY domain-containing protein [Phycisphaerae bacterium]MDW8261388.1 YdjY domain-containing protein [Phycisphaerales bacterium]
MKVLRDWLLMMWLLTSNLAAGQAATRPAKLPFIEVDMTRKQVRVDCQAIRVDAPLEFFCVAIGGPEHEAVLRTPARPSDVHLALLMLGLEPGQPVRFSEAAQKWLAPDGPPLRISVEFEKAGERVIVPAHRLMKSIRHGQVMPDRPFVFTGSRMLEDGRYAADVTGYLVSIVNFDLSPIDVPRLASNANDTLEWQVNEDVAPEMGAKVTMILEPIGSGDAAAQGAPLPSGSEVQTRPATLRSDPQKLERLERLWAERVAPHDAALRQAAQAQYDVIRELRREQQRLIDEADRIQRLIDELEKRYQDMTTPRPEPLGPAPSQEPPGP